MTGIPFPDIDPIALQLGPLAIRWYALAYLAGFILGWRYCLRLVDMDPESKPNRAMIDDFLTWAVVGVILGGRMGYVLFYMPEYYLSHPKEILMVWQGGMSFHGGMIGAIVAMFVFSFKRGISFFRLSDLVATVVPIGLFLGRIANFLNGELYGRVTDMPWGVIFPDGGSVPRHPSQLYEALLEGGVLFVVMFVLSRRRHLRLRHGFLSGAFLSGYAISRIIVEFFREPDKQIGFIANAITMGQLLSLPMLLLGIWLMFHGTRVTEKCLSKRPDE